MTTLSFGPIVHTCLASAFSSLVGLHIGHVSTLFINTEEEKSFSATCSHVTSYALTALASYGIGRIFAPTISSEPLNAITCQSAAIATSSLISCALFLRKRTLPHAIGTAVAVSPIASLLLPRPLAAAATSIAVFAALFFHPHNTPHSSIQTPEAHEPLRASSHWIFRDILAIAFVTVVASTQGTMFQAQGK